MDDGEVGYGRPPKHTRFEKGKSGNPYGRRGRKPKEQTRPEIVRRVRDEKVPIKLNGREIRVTAFEAMVRTMFNRVMQRGNARDLKALFELLDQYGGLSLVDEGKRSREAADAVINKMMTAFCRENNVDEEEVALRRQQRQEEIVLLFEFPQLVTALRKLWKKRDSLAPDGVGGKSPLRSAVEEHWKTL